jgi:thiol:disulfide interchange protein
MDTFKQFMAFLLLGTVVYLFSTINDSLHVATLTLLIGIWFACWLVGKTPYTASTAKLATTWGAAGLAGALIGYGAFTFLVPGDHELQWREFDPDLVLAEQRQGRTAMVDFTADWCPTCQLNMHLVIDTKTVGKITNANDVAVFKADWSDRNPTIKAALAQLRSKSIPLLAIYPANQPGKVIVLRDTISQKQLLRALALAGAERNNDQADWARTHREQRVAQLSRAAN